MEKNPGVRRGICFDTSAAGRKNQGMRRGTWLQNTSGSAIFKHTDLQRHDLVQVASVAIASGGRKKPGAKTTKKNIYNNINYCGVVSIKFIKTIYRPGQNRNLKSKKTCNYVHSV